MIGKENHSPDFCKVKLCGFKPPKLCKVWIGNRYRETALPSKPLLCASLLKKKISSTHAEHFSEAPYHFHSWSFPAFPENDRKRAKKEKYTLSSFKSTVFVTFFSSRKIRTKKELGI